EEPHEEKVEAESIPIDGVVVDGVLPRKKVSHKGVQERVQRHLDKADEHRGREECAQTVPEVAMLIAEYLYHATEQQSARAGDDHSRVHKDVREKVDIFSYQNVFFDVVSA